MDQLNWVQPQRHRPCFLSRLDLSSPFFRIGRCSGVNVMFRLRFAMVVCSYSFPLSFCKMLHVECNVYF